MKFIAHRGYSKKYHENSLEAFSAVLASPQLGKNLIGIELDIQLTADDRIPITHDTTLPDEREHQKDISSLTYDSLQSLERRKYNCEQLHVPDLNETLQFVNHRTELNIEIKEGKYDLERLTELFTELLESYSPRGDIVISSFSCDILRFVISRTLHLNVKYAYIYRTWDAWACLPDDVYESIHFLHPWYKLVLDKPGAFLTYGLPLQCWTVDDPDVVQQLMDLPCAGRIRSIMTNDIFITEKF